MNRLDDIFTLHTARSTSFDDHEYGTVPFVSNGLKNNGVVGLVTPDPDDKVFEFSGICVSAFADATPHMGSFVARGNGGSGLVVLEPKYPMSDNLLLRIAAFINSQVSWRFNWSRQATANRLRSVILPDALQEMGQVNRGVLPSKGGKSRTPWSLNTETYLIEELFDLEPGYYHALNRLDAGSVPVVSCSGEDNGIAGYFCVDTESLHKNKLTIALNGSPLLTKWHPYTFAGKDDVAICTSKLQLQATTIYFIQVMLNRERWRFSYYRKCYMNKLRHISIALPSTDGGIDEMTIATIVEAAPFWDYVSSKVGVA